MRYIAVLTLYILCLCAPAPAHAETDSPAHTDGSLWEIDSVDIYKLFSIVNETPPSNISIKENTAIIQRRIDCFAQNFNYAMRTKICMDNYISETIAVARANVSGRPQIGLYTKNVAYCPIMYNLCAGKTDVENQPLEMCVTFERQCIDYMLDTYWRGAPFFNHMQLRSD